MKKVKSSVLTILCLCALASCTKDNGNGSTHVDANKIYSDADLTPAQKSEKLALAGEQLVTPTSFMYANIVFDMALAQDSTNKRAQFYKAFLGQELQMHGILARIKPFVDKNTESKKQYDDAVNHLPISGLKNFMFDGQPDIKTEKDAQAYLDSVYKTQDNFREFLKANKDLNLTLNLNDWTGLPSIQDAIEKCPVTQSGEGVFDIATCDYTHALQINLNRADIEALEQIVAGEQIYFALYTAYDATGAIAASDKFDGQHAPNSVVYKELSKNADFGKIRNSGSALKAVIGMGIDAVAGVRWAASMQQQLCPNGEDATNRPGFLFKTGMCIRQQNGNGPSLNDILKTVDLALAGQTIVLKDPKAGDVQIRPAAILSSPIQDLKSLQPQFDACDNVSSFVDASVGGLFPNHDVNSILAKNSNCK